MIREEDYFNLLISLPIWKEYNTVADWLIPGSKKLEKERIFNVLRFQSIWVEPKIKLTVCNDLSDNHFLECAVAGNADYLVTKNVRISRQKNMPVLKLYEFVNS